MRSITKDLVIHCAVVVVVLSLSTIVKQCEGKKTEWNVSYTRPTPPPRTLAIQINKQQHKQEKK